MAKSTTPNGPPMRLLIGFCLLAITLAGCAENATSEDTAVEDDPALEVEVTDELGGIRGVVVNDAIVPIAGATVELPLGSETLTTETDEEGRFTFSKIAPGSYFLTISKANHESAQAGVVVEAGEESPEIIKVQLNRLFAMDPYYVTDYYQAFIGCAYSFSVSSTCVNDYTRICGNVDPSCCPGGCVPQVTGIVDQREYQSGVGPGWSSIVWEMSWETSAAGTGEELGLTVSYAAREGAGHWFATHRGPMPWRLQCDVGVNCPGMQESNGPPQIDPEGRDDLWNMLGAGASSVTVQQEVEIFQSNFYYAQVPGEWSFIQGDPDPF